MSNYVSLIKTEYSVSLMKKTKQGEPSALSSLSSADTARALGLLEEYCTKLKKPEEQQLKTALQRVMGIFKSNLFEALLGKSIFCFNVWKSELIFRIHNCCQ